jgi:hypothetical protein
MRVRPPWPDSDQSAVQVAGFQGASGYVSKSVGCMPLTAIRGKTECPRRVSVSLRVGFDSHRLHHDCLTNTTFKAEVSRGVSRHDAEHATRLGKVELHTPNGLAIRAPLPVPTASTNWAWPTHNSFPDVPLGVPPRLRARHRPHRVDLLEPWTDAATLTNEFLPKLNACSTRQRYRLQVPRGASRKRGWRHETEQASDA